MNKQFSLMGYTIVNAEQARSVLLMAKLQGRSQVVKQAISIIAQYEA